MLRFLVFSTLVACAFGNVLLPRTLPLPDGRIVGGTVAKPGECAYQGALRVYGQFICGVSILNKRWAMTAAHCCPYGAENYTVEFGSTKLGSGIIVAVETVIIHEEYNAATADYDVCVIQVAVVISTSNMVKVIPLAKKEPHVNETAIVCGWGATREGGPSTIQLQKVWLKIVSQDTCNEAYNPLNRDVTKRMICAAKDGKDSCQGDSGGALVVDGQQAGIVSWGYGCARFGYPGVYTRVDALHSWIEDKTQE